MNKLLHLDFNFFLLVTTQVFFATTYIFLIILSLLYYRFKPDYRHRFIQRLAIYFSLISIAGSIIVLFLYFSTIKDIIAPSLIDNLVQQTASSETHLNSVFFILSLSLVIAYSFVYKKFSRRRSKINSKLYIFFYLLLITVLIIITSRTGDQYFGFNDPDALKIKIFTFEYGFSGILWQYLFMISVYSIIFSIFIYYKKDKFIGSQFAVSYTLKLAGLNYFSTVILFFVSSLPIILSNYFKFF